MLRLDGALVVGCKPGKARIDLWHVSLPVKWLPSIIVCFLFLFLRIPDTLPGRY
jgi:hypothetical protein